MREALTKDLQQTYVECQNKENHHELGEIFSLAFRDANSE